MKDNHKQQNQEIVHVVAKNKAGISRRNLLGDLTFSITDKTLQRRLSALCERGLLHKTGERKATLYYPVNQFSRTLLAADKDNLHEVFTKNSLDTLKHLDISTFTRTKVSYKRQLLDDYVPNETIYVPVDMRQRLLKSGQRIEADLAAGTYAQQICQRLLIDLSYNSSRLEGNTYSELDTKKLVEQGISAKGKVNEETVMIMNHKEAILFLIQNAVDIEPTPFTIYNLHHLLSQDLLVNPNACGKVREVEVNIGRSTYHPLNNPHQLQELLALLLLKAKKITDPFEQSFFMLVHLSYLQAFEDVNKRTSRLSCNIPFIKHNLCPLSFTDLPKEDYTAALLIVYETLELGPLLDLFCWAYLRSCNQYEVVKTSIGEIDPYRIESRQQRKMVIGQVIRNDLHGQAIEQFVEDYCFDHKIKQVDKFMVMTLADIERLHSGAIIGLGISEGQFLTWASGYMK